MEIFTVDGWKKFQKIQEITGRLTGPIKEILAIELAAGNKIIGASDDWPTENANITLESKFSADYRPLYPNLTYMFDNDPHYWRDAYLDKENQEFIAVRFHLDHEADSPA